MPRSLRCHSRANPGDCTCLSTREMVLSGCGPGWTPLPGRWHSWVVVQDGCRYQGDGAQVVVQDGRCHQGDGAQVVVQDGRRHQGDGAWVVLQDGCCHQEMVLQSWSRPSSSGPSPCPLLPEWLPGPLSLEKLFCVCHWEQGHGGWGNSLQKPRNVGMLASSQKDHLGGHRKPSLRLRAHSSSTRTLPGAHQPGARCGHSSA